MAMASDGVAKTGTHGDKCLRLNAGAFPTPPRPNSARPARDTFIQLQLKGSVYGQPGDNGAECRVGYVGGTEVSVKSP
ncbi:hypothetical protein PGT21_031029 [Puccinia graminis f. sp. tritici]|uniref:Uncharacterized protein n=1 Tax=Puccinia graminis f. sp. tritici TaxID=56615 RepID=A0A5B0QVP8_PUCGR|nr:hypothetical protein PGT21_031029 [Puccinia graminis f. sp. tritici]KAA1116814.1 hypothetical protein PGTUg99_021856 [Puccinia graminis f. sp. tritici]